MTAPDDRWMDISVREGAGTPGGPTGRLIRVERHPRPAVPAVTAPERPAAKRPGDRVELGDVLGHPMEPWERWARVVGISKRRGPRQYVIRLYGSDAERWPSGAYLTTWFAVAYVPPEDYARGVR